MKTLSSTEEVIRKLYAITYDYEKGFEYQMINLLKIGIERFGLDIGVFSKIEQDTHIIQYCMAPPEVLIHKDDQFDFDDTYSSIRCFSQDPIALAHVAKDAQLATRSVYKVSQLESYIGIAINIKDEFYGTLSFSSALALPRKFLDIDIDVLGLMASWIEVELMRRKQENKLNVLNQSLKYQANYDLLTNIYNRRGMYENLHKGLNLLNRAGGDFTLAIIDIDHFKKFNDTYGHQKGDEALVCVVKKIKESIRDYEFVARLGGEEFIIWLPNTNHQGSAVVFERIMQSISTIPIARDPITVSIGSCYFIFNNKYSGDLTKLVDELMSKADRALYEAKSKGRNRFVNHQAGQVSFIGLAAKEALSIDE